MAIAFDSGIAVEPRPQGQHHDQRARRDTEKIVWRLTMNCAARSHFQPSPLPYPQPLWRSFDHHPQHNAEIAVRVPTQIGANTVILKLTVRTTSVHLRRRKQAPRCPLPKQFHRHRPSHDNRYRSLGWPCRKLGLNRAQLGVFTGMRQYVSLLASASGLHRPPRSRVRGSKHDSRAPPTPSIHQGGVRAFLRYPSSDRHPEGQTTPVLNVFSVLSSECVVDHSPV